MLHVCEHVIGVQNLQALGMLQGVELRMTDTAGRDRSMCNKLHVVHGCCTVLLFCVLEHVMAPLATLAVC